MVEKKRKVSARELDYNKAKQAKNYVVSTRQTTARGRRKRRADKVAKEQGDGREG